MPCRGPCDKPSPDGKHRCTYNEGHARIDNLPNCSWHPSELRKREEASQLAAFRRSGGLPAASQITYTQLLCSACRVLERLGYDFDENPALSQWWSKHKKEDDA